MPGSQVVSTLHQPKNDTLSFFKFLLKKVSPLDKRNFMHLLNKSKCFVIWFLQLTTLKIIQKCALAFLSSRDFFFSRASPAQKSRGLRVFYSKNFSRATFFVFWVTQLVDMFLSYLTMEQIWRKSAVWYCDGVALQRYTWQKIPKFLSHLCPCAWSWPTPLEMIPLTQDHLPYSRPNLLETEKFFEF